MEAVLEWVNANADILKLISIPFISGLIGWGTNVIAVQMTFYPLEFFGLKWKKIMIGWQGIIPMKSVKMAGISVDLMTSKLISIKDVIMQLDPEEMAKEMGPHMVNMTEKVMSETLEESDFALWEAIPQSIKERIYGRVTLELPMLIEEMMKDVSENIEEVFDLKKMVVEALLKDKQLMVDIFLKCGAEEFKFIEKSGFYFGFLFGLIQMTLWYFIMSFFPDAGFLPYILPIFGAIVGYMTNYLALKLIFEPKQPIQILFWKIQGLFIKRQNEVSAEYAKIVSAHIINSQNIYNEMIYGPSVDNLVKLVQVHVKKALDISAGYTKPIIQIIVGPQKYIQVKKKLVKRFVFALPGPIKKSFDYTERALDMENLLRTRLQALPPEEFEGILRPAFQEEELKLILVGAALGAFAGFLQFALMFA